MSNPQPITSTDRPAILARGPWELGDIRAEWVKEHYLPTDTQTAAADIAIARLRDRGSPSHDGLAGRMVDYRIEVSNEHLFMQMQPLRWALRLNPEDACESVAALCVTRSADGRWLAGRRAPWVASWAGRWALGAGGAVDCGENPGTTLIRELDEEWSVSPARIRGEALVRLPKNLIMFVGQAWLDDDANVMPDHEHDAFRWWPEDVEAWPDHADEGLRTMARLLSQ